MPSLYDYFPLEVLFQIFDFLTLNDLYGRVVYVDKKISRFLSSHPFKLHLL